MMHANRSTFAKLCLLTALAVPVQRTASANEANRTVALAPASSALVAQAGTDFTPPASLDSETTLLIDGSSSMQTMNEALTEQFLERYDNAEVESATSGTDIALQRLQAGEINLAAIGRPLTEEEENAGFVSVPVAFEKIAIFVSPENSFEGDLTFEQFVRIFRGEITDWSEVGGDSGPIRFVDRPESSDTRIAFSRYDAFKSAGAFENGATATPVDVDETSAVVEQLGDDGIGYAIANQVLGDDSVNIIPMHQTLPDNPAYPYSQPRSYVYFGQASPAVEGFLAVATGAEGQAVVEEVQATEGAAAAQLDGVAPEVTNGELTARTNENNVAVLEDSSGNLVAAPLAAAGGAVTALAFSPDGQTLATGTNTGKVRYWNTDGTPKGDIFDPGNGNAITDLNFEENDKLSVTVANENRRGLWGLNGLPFGEEAAAPGTIATPDVEADGVPFWLWLIPLLGLLGAGLWWLLGKNRSTTPPEPKRQTAPTATVPPPVTDPDSEREVSSRAQTVIKTDRVTDDSRAVTPSADLPGSPSIPETPTVAPTQTAVNEPNLPEFESTDLEEPDLAGTNLDLRTAGLAGGAAALGAGAIAAGALGNELSSEPEVDDETGDVWDDNIDLSLDDPDLPPTADLTDSSPEAGTAGNLDDIEPTRETVIAETADVPDNMEPDSQTIIGDDTVIFRGAAADDAFAEAASPEAIAPTSGGFTASAEPDSPAIGNQDLSNQDLSNQDVIAQSISAQPPSVQSPSAPELNAPSGTTGGTVASADIDSFFGAETEAPEIDESVDDREESLEAGLAPVLEDAVLEEPVAEPAVDPDPFLNPEPVLESDVASDAASDAVTDTEPLLEPADSEPLLEPAETEPLLEPVSEPILDPAVVLGSAAAGIAGGMVNSIRLKQQGDSLSSEVAPSTAPSAEVPRRYTVEELASVDDDLLELPEGYGESRIVLLPRDPKWAYAYWDVSNEHKEELRRQGGQRLALRLYDVTEIDQNQQTPHSMQQQDCDEMARSWYLEIPVSDRDYTVEIGYLTGDDRWLVLARSAPIRVPPIYPSDWVNDQFVTIGFDESLAGRTFGNLGRKPSADGNSAVDDLPEIYDELFAMTQGQNALRVAGSLFGSMHQVAPGALSPSGNVSGLNMSGLNVSGLNMSGVGLPRKRNFWLVADAELIVYGATEPSATLTVGDRVVPLGPDGTFRFHMHFPDGKMNYPIRAVAVDGEQSRSITMNFERGTPERNTNTKEDAQDEWF